MISNRSVPARLARRFARRSAGGAAVEMAVVFPVLLLLIVGIVDYGRVFYTSVTVANAARAGAEFGAQNPTTETDTVAMRAHAQADGAEAGTLTVIPRWYCECSGAAHASCSICGGGAAPEVYVEVTAQKTVDMLLPLPGLPSSMTVVRKATFRSQ